MNEDYFSIEAKIENCDHFGVLRDQVFIKNLGSPRYKIGSEQFVCDILASKRMNQFFIYCFSFLGRLFGTYGTTDRHTDTQRRYTYIISVY